MSDFEIDRLANPFKETALEYTLKGWCVVPLPERAKKKPPDGATGRKGTVPTDEDIAGWVRSGYFESGKSRVAIGNIAVRAGNVIHLDDNEYEVIGIDVDAYELKRGKAELDGLEKALGPLPDTYTSSARKDGVSGIRWYLTPKGYEYMGKPRLETGQSCSSIEIVQRVHRYGLVYPSTNPDTNRPYRWYPPGAKPDGQSYTVQIPYATGLTKLPKAWFEHLTRGGMAYTGEVPVDMDTDPQDLKLWATGTKGSEGKGKGPQAGAGVKGALPEGRAICGQTQKALEKHLDTIANGPNHHDALTAAHWEILHLAVEGHTGWLAAVKQINKVWIDRIVSEGNASNRSLFEAKSECSRSFMGVLRKIKGKYDELSARGLSYVAEEDVCAKAVQALGFSGGNGGNGGNGGPGGPGSISGGISGGTGAGLSGNPSGVTANSTGAGFSSGAAGYVGPGAAGGGASGAVGGASGASWAGGQGALPGATAGGAGAGGLPAVGTVVEDPKKPSKLADWLMDRWALQNRRIITRLGEFYQYNGMQWEQRSEAELLSELYPIFDRCLYLHITVQGQTPRPFDPDENKLRKVLHALKAKAPCHDDIKENTWFSGERTVVIPCRNGLVRAADKVLIPHTSDYFCTYVIQADYDPTATCPKTDAFIRHLASQDQYQAKLLYEWMGYVVAGNNRFQKGLILKGKSGCGKGVYSRLLSMLVGKDNYAFYKVADFKGNAFAKEPLVGKSLVTFSDNRSDFTLPGFVDLVLEVIGQDATTIRMPYARKSFTVHLPCRFMILTNLLPSVADDSGAFVRRFVVVDCTAEVTERVEDYEEQLYAELPGIINQMLRGLHNLENRRGGFTQPEASAWVLTAMRESSSLEHEFVNDRCELGPASELFSVERDKLYAEYQIYCSVAQVKALSKAKFAEALVGLGGIELHKRGTRESGQKWFVEGIQLKKSRMKVKTASEAQAES